MPTMEPIFKCPKCKKHNMCLRSKKDNNGYFFTCLGKPECIHVIWLADVIKEARVHENECNKCRNGNKKIVIKFKSNNLLAMLNLAFINDNDRTYESCIVCDNSLRIVLDIGESSMRADQPAATNRVQTNNRVTPPANPPRANANTNTRPPNNHVALPNVNPNPNPRPNPNRNQNGNQSFTRNTGVVQCTGCHQPAVK